mgnify:CR=1 FL=1
MTELQNNRMRQGKNNMPPDLQSRGHNYWRFKQDFCSQTHTDDLYFF